MVVTSPAGFRGLVPLSNLSTDAQTMHFGKYLFRFDDAILLGCCSGALTTTASLGMINDRAKSQIPGLGYTVTYAVGNTLLTIWGMVLVMLLT